MGRYARVSWRRMVGEWEGRVSWRRMVGEWEGRVSWRRMVGEWEGTLELAGGEWWVSGKVR